MRRSGLTPETFTRIEALVNALLDGGDAAINRSVYLPHNIEFGQTVNSHGQIWLRVKSTYECLCCLLDPSHPQKTGEARRTQRDNLRYSLDKLKEVGLLKPVDDDTSNIARQSGTHFHLKLNFNNKDESQKILKAQLRFSNSSISKNSLLPGHPESEIDFYVCQVRQKLNGIIQQEYGQILVFGISQLINVTDLYVQTDVWQQIIERRSQSLQQLLQSAYSSDHLNRLGLEANEPPRHSGWKTAENLQRLMVLGKPGVGKTTYIRYLGVQCIEGSFQPDKVPIFVYLSEFERVIRTEPNATLLNFICSNLSGWGIDTKPFHLILEAGRALLLFDGLDEVSSDSAERVTSQLEQFTAQYPRNSFLITCRVAADRYRFARKNFVEIEVADLNRAQAELFIRLWFGVLLRDHPDAAQNQAEVLIAMLNQPKHRAIQDLTVTPLMLNLVCTVFQATEELPGTRSQLFKQGIDILLKDWDLHRHVKRDAIYPNWSQVRTLELLLEIAQTTFEQAHFLFEQRQAERITQFYLEQIEPASVSSVHVQEASESILRGIASHHGLLAERATGIFSFSHLTVHEYFTARSIYLKQDWETLLPQICNSQWREVFLLVAEMQTSGDTLVCKMHQQIQKIFSSNVELQHLLSWVNDMAVKAAKSLPYKPSALRAWYLCLAGYTFDEGVESFRKSGQADVDYQAFSLARSMGLDAQFASDISELNLLYQRICDALSLVAEEKVATNLMTALLYFRCDRLIDGLLPVILPIKALLLQLDNLTLSPQQNLFLSWWKQKGQTWALSVLEHYQSLLNEAEEGSPHLQEASKDILKRYYDANLLLLDCLRCAEFVTPSVQKSIEIALLLPNAAAIL